MIINDLRFLKFIFYSLNILWSFCCIFAFCLDSMGKKYVFPSQWNVKVLFILWIEKIISEQWKAIYF